MSLNILQDSPWGGLLDLDGWSSLSSTSARASGDAASVSSRLEIRANEGGGEVASTTIAKAVSDGVEVVSTASASAEGEVASVSTDVTAIVETQDDGSVTADGSAEARAMADMAEGSDFDLPTAVTEVRATGPDFAISREGEAIEIDDDPLTVESFASLEAPQGEAVQHAEIELPFLAADELLASILTAMPVTG